LIREFILFSRLGRTDTSFTNLREAGRLDIVHECIVASLFLSHRLRRNVLFHAVLSGAPNPPLHIEINGANLYDVRTDVITWQEILRKVISGKTHPGIKTSKTSFESILKAKAKNSRIYVLEEGGKDIHETKIEPSSVFVLGDHVGLPRKAESFALRFGDKVSLGKQPYLAASCITIINYLLDKQIRQCF